MLSITAALYFASSVRSNAVAMTTMLLRIELLDPQVYPELGA